MNHKTPKWVLGIDFGGTNLRGALVNPEGSLEFPHSAPIGEIRTPESVINRITSLCRLLIDQAGTRGIKPEALGIGAPGPLRLPEGIVASSPHFPDWVEIPLVDELHSRLRIPVFLDNDANVAAFCEYWLGKGRNHDHLALFTLGTGFGSGLILNGDVWRGVDGSGGETGHMTIDVNGPTCFCGNNGCLETFVSCTSITRRYRELLIRDDSVGNLPDNITALFVYEQALAGDQQAIQILHETGSYLGVAIANLVNILNIKLFLLSGGLSGAHVFFLEHALQEAGKRAFKSSMEGVQLELAGFSRNAGLVGAAGIAFRSLKII